ncbi:DJ-1/PfpI family protein [Chromobacterium phragmitis]|uniref:DJ-1/PfpI family protein n=1 Tax=Chromobacterium phragmitis TaxID=2202141 RepID=A0ABV0IS68_9NEIS
MHQPYLIVFALYPGVTQLDFTGPLEFLSKLPRARCLLASRRGEAIRADGGVVFSDIARLSDIEHCDLLLGAAGLLRGRRAACHWAWLDSLAAFGAQPCSDRIVMDGKLISGGGVTAGIDMALALMAKIAGRRFAQTVQLALEYAPAPPFASGRPELASPEVLAAARQRMDQMRDRREAAVVRAAAAML